MTLGDTETQRAAQRIVDKIIVMDNNRGNGN
jgi:hypothetical protein